MSNTRESTGSMQHETSGVLGQYTPVLAGVISRVLHQVVTMGGASQALCEEVIIIVIYQKGL